MSIAAANLTDGIRVDQATQKGSVYDVIRLVTKKKGGDTIQTFSRIQKRHTEFITKCDKLRINGKGRETPVANAATLVEIAWLCPGKAAVQFRRKGAETVCRILGGDLTLVDEIQHRHAQVAGTAEEEFLLADAQGGNTQQPVSHKRCLDDDDEVYAAKKQQVLRQIRQETAGTELTFMKQHAQGSMSILDMLSTGNAAPATMQLLQCTLSCLMVTDFIYRFHLSYSFPPFVLPSLPSWCSAASCLCSNSQYCLDCLVLSSSASLPVLWACTAEPQVFSAE